MLDPDLDPMNVDAQNSLNNPGDKTQKGSQKYKK
jgi:hypothetical protein